MKDVLFIGQITDISGYGNASRCYLNNLISLHNDKKINLSVLNFSFEAGSKISTEEKQRRFIHVLFGNLMEYQVFGYKVTKI